MKVMVLVKATRKSENGVMPDTKLLTEMGKYNEELVKAGIMLAGDGLHPSKSGKRIVMGTGKRTVVDGPFTETKELVAGYWVWQVKSMEEAGEWARRCPDPMPGEESILELRPVFGLEDSGDAATPEIRAKEQELSREIERRNKQ